jgi:hydrogenase nickel incorporation protein HypB
MCDTCGCGQPENNITIRIPGDESSVEETHSHYHSHGDVSHSHEHSHDHPGTDAHYHHDADHAHLREIKVEQDILQKNNLLAERNRGFFEAKNIVAINLVSSPGSGKTTLLERTIRDTKDIMYHIVEGDQQTMNDAMRIKATGVPVVQINTGTGCHLDADMVNKAVKLLQPPEHSVFFIENVGNLVCPALFDLGEKVRIVIMSVTEGDDKPLKYPTMFRSSHICIINKTDLLPYVDFDMAQARSYALQVNPHLLFFEVSARTGHGMKEWYTWLREQV